MKSNFFLTANAFSRSRSLLTVPSFNHLHFHRPRNYRHVLVRNNTVWARPSSRNTNKQIGTDKLGETTSRMRGQAPKRYPKLRRPMTNFLLLWWGISLGSDALWKLKQRSVTQLFYSWVRNILIFIQSPSTEKNTNSQLTSSQLAW